MKGQRVRSLLAMLVLLSGGEAGLPHLGADLKMQTVLIESPALFGEVLRHQARQNGTQLLDTAPACTPSKRHVRAEGKVWLQPFQNGVSTPFGRLGQDGPHQVSFAEATFTLRACVYGQKRQESVVLQAFGHPEWARGRDLLEDISSSLFKAARDLQSQRLNSRSETSSGQSRVARPPQR